MSLVARTRVLSLVGVALAGLTACSGSPASGSSSQASVQVKADDRSCALSRDTLSAGTASFAISNSGSKTTEVYLYAAGDRIVAEKENIAPGLSYELTAQLTAGSYVVACKPGQTGDGLRTPLTVNASADAPAADPAAGQAVAAYRSYVQQQVDQLVPLVQQLSAATRGDDLDRAKALYGLSRLPWESIEPVAEAFGDLDFRMDARQANLEPGQPWTGWHRLEKGLWQDGSTAGLGSIADELTSDALDLQNRVAVADLTATSIANGAKELLDEVATTKVTGEEEVFSHIDLVDFSGNLEGARQAFDALRPLARRNDPELVTAVDEQLTAVDNALALYRTPEGFISYDTVSPNARRELARTIDALGAPLSQLAAAVANPNN